MKNTHSLSWRALSGRARPLTAWSGLCLAGTLLAQTPTVITDHSTYLPGEDIAAQFQNGPGNRLDWIGLYPEGVEPGTQPSTRWIYVDNTTQGAQGLREGVVVLGGGLNLAGNYVAYLLENDGYTKLAQTAFVVVDPGTAAVRTDKRTYTTGAPIAVTFTNGPANPKDWIGIYKEGQTPGGGPASTLWAYTDGTQSGATGLTDGTVTFASGLAAAGNYDVYLLVNDGYDVLGKETIKVVPASSSIPRILSVTPGNGAANQPPVITYTATVTNGQSKVVPASVTLTLNGAVVPHQYSEVNDLVTITYTNPALFPAGSTQNYELRFYDNRAPANEYASLATITVANYRNIVLPAPLVFENFDSTPEGQLPAGWTQVSYTEVLNPDFDLGDLNSASYAQWLVVNADRFQGSFVTYSNPANTSTDYHRVLSVNPLNVVNGRVLNEPLAAGRFAFGDSGYRNGQSQVVYLFTPDFNLTGKSDIHLSFHSLWEQNQDSIAAVEYSTNQGQTWLPVVYMLDGPDVLKVEGTQTVDAVATFTTEYADVARYLDPETAEEKGGTYGAFIGAAITPDLAPYISARVDNDPVESKRVELFRLPAADNQAKVRFRFAHAGSDSWYFGIDDFGLYSIPANVEPPTLTASRSGNSVVISWPATATGFTLESTPALGTPDWTPVSGVTGNQVTVSTTGAGRFYRLRQ